MIGAFGFVLSSTAVIMKMMEDRGEVSSPSGQRSVAILLLEDLAIIPLLALVAVLATLAPGAEVDAHAAPLWQTIGLAGWGRGDRVRRRALSDEPAVRIPGMDGRAGSDDGRCADGGSRGRAADGPGRPFDGHGRLPCRRAALRIHFPSPA